MEFSWPIFATGMLAVLLMAFASSLEGTFDGEQLLKVNVPFVWHWGTWPSCLLLSAAAGYVFPLLMKNPVPFWNKPYYYGMATVASMAITAVLFRFWRPTDSKDNCPIQLEGKGVTITGCIFFSVFVAFLVILLFGYVPTKPVFPRVAWTVCGFLVPWPILGTLCVNWRVNYGRKDFDSDESRKNARIITAILEIGILVMTLCKS